MSQLLILLLRVTGSYLIGSLEGYFDQKKSENAKIKHKKSFVWRLVFGIPAEALIAYNFYLYSYSIGYSIGYFAFSLIIDGLIYLVALNITFNLRDNRKINALGTTAKTDNKLDERWIIHIPIITFLWILTQTGLIIFFMW